MLRSPTAAITILSLVLLAVCCQILPSMHMHDAMESGPESMAHLILLTMSAPGSVWAAMVLALLFVVVSAGIPVRAQTVSATLRLYARSPDNIFSPPLVRAFADGILNPKLW